MRPKDSKGLGISGTQPFNKYQTHYHATSKRSLTPLSNDETRRALRKQYAVEEPAIGVGCWAKQATHHAVKSWREARA